MSATTTEPDTWSTKWLGRAGVVLAGFGFVLVGDIFGLGAAVLLGVAWYMLPVPYAVAIGHVLFAVLLPAEPGVLDIVPAELGLLCLLGAVAPSRDGIARFGALLVGATLTLSGVAALGFRIGALPGAAFSLVAASLLGGYGLHRYELLRLGLLEDSGGRSEAVPGPDTDGSRDSQTDATTHL
jgi:hypothetical protein